MDVVLRLGDVTFEGFEIPERMPFGGQQRLAVHQFPGGARHVQSLGRDDEPIEWSGTFLGEQAPYRARALDAMRADGRERTLSWHEFIYSVVVDRFHGDFEAPFRVPYSIRCTVVEDLTARIDRAPLNNLDRAVRADIIGCEVDVATVADGPLSAVFETLRGAARTIVQFQNAAHATIAPVLSAANDVRARVRVLQDTAGAALNGAAALVSVVPGGGRLAERLRSAADGAVRLPALQRLDWRIGRLATNLSTANFGAAAVVRTLSGSESLFRVASEEYGDPRRWDEIARASGRSDPRLIGISRIRVPQ